MKTFWLYWQGMLITAVRWYDADSAIFRALAEHRKNPTVNALCGDYTPFEIELMIKLSTVRE